MEGNKLANANNASNPLSLILYNKTHRMCQGIFLITLLRLIHLIFLTSTPCEVATEAQRGWTTYPQPHSKYTIELQGEDRQVGCRKYSLTTLLCQATKTGLW